MLNLSYYLFIILNTYEFSIILKLEGKKNTILNIYIKESINQLTIPY